MKMQVLQVGKPYPQKLHVKNGMVLQPDGSGLMGLVHLSQFEPGDKNALAGPLTVAVLQARPAVPWVAIRYHKNGLCLDVPLFVGHRRERRESLLSGGNGLQLIALKGGHHTIKNLRLLGLSDEVMSALRSATKQETIDRADMRRITRRLQSEYRTSDDVFEAASVKQRFD